MTALKLRALQQVKEAGRKGLHVERGWESRTQMELVEEGLLWQEHGDRKHRDHWKFTISPSGERALVDRLAAGHHERRMAKPWLTGEIGAAKAPSQWHEIKAIIGSLEYARVQVGYSNFDCGPIDCGRSRLRSLSNGQSISRSGRLLRRSRGPTKCCAGQWHPCLLTAPRR